MLHRHPEWVRTCGDCTKWVMKPFGQFVTYGPNDDQRIPLQGSPPCYRCPKHQADAPLASKTPLPPDEDFGPWFDRFYWWYQEVKVCGFQQGGSPTLRRIAAVFAAEEDMAGRGERAMDREIMLMILRRVVK